MGRYLDYKSKNYNDKTFANDLLPILEKAFKEYRFKTAEYIEKKWKEFAAEINNDVDGHPGIVIKTNSDDYGVKDSEELPFTEIEMNRYLDKYGTVPTTIQSAKFETINWFMINAEGQNARVSGLKLVDIASILIKGYYEDLKGKKVKINNSLIIGSNMTYNIERPIMKYWQEEEIMPYEIVLSYDNVNKEIFYEIRPSKSELLYFDKFMDISDPFNFLDHSSKYRDLVLNEGKYKDTY